MGEGGEEGVMVAEDAFFLRPSDFNMINVSCNERLLKERACFLSRDVLRSSPNERRKKLFAVHFLVVS